MVNAKKVLVTEDDQFLRSIIVSVLKEHNIEVITVADGSEAISAMNDHDIDLVLLDLLMPNVDGYAVLKYMKQEKKNIPVVVLTNIDDPESRKQCQKFGCKDFFIKSGLDEDDIWPAIQKYLTR